MSVRGRKGVGVREAQKGPTDDDEGCFVSADSKCLIRNRESNHFSWWTPQETVDYFKTFYDLILKKSFFTPIMLKVMIYSYQGASPAPTPFLPLKLICSVSIYYDKCR